MPRISQQQCIWACLSHFTSSLPRDTLLFLGMRRPTWRSVSPMAASTPPNFLGNTWSLFFPHPWDFTIMCTNNLGRAAKPAPQFASEMLVVLPVDSVKDHLEWNKEINACNGYEPTKNYPFALWMIIVHSQRVGMLHPAKKDEKGIWWQILLLLMIMISWSWLLPTWLPLTGTLMRFLGSSQLTGKTRSPPADDNGAGKSFMPSLRQKSVNFSLEKSSWTSHVARNTCFTPQP